MCLLIHWVLTILSEEQRCYWTQPCSLQYFKMSVHYFNTSRCCNRFLDRARGVICAKTSAVCPRCVLVMNFRLLFIVLFLWPRLSTTYGCMNLDVASILLHTDSGLQACWGQTQTGLESPEYLSCRLCQSVNLIQETIKHILKETVSYVAQSSCAVLNAGRKSQFLTRI